METKKEKNTGRYKNKDDVTEYKKKSAFTLFWEKYPNGAGEIIDMRAVLK
jgi:hypothetical protein